jgi:hypothetical protein
MKACTTYTILLTAAALLSPSLAVHGDDLEALLKNSKRDPSETAEMAVPASTKIRMDDPIDVVFDASRSLQDAVFEDESAQCYTTGGKTPSRYCTVDDTPRDGTFLVLACPTSTDDYSKCACAIGIGNSEDAPATRTCDQCNFCKDQSLAYDCRNVAEGTCIGYNCNGECISSLEPEEDLILTDVSGAAHANLNSYRAVGIVALASSLVVWLA